MIITLNSVYEETNVLSELKKAVTPSKVRKLLKDLTTKELEEVITVENKWYHSKSKPRISDMVFDVVKEVLEERKPTSKALKDIGSTVVYGKKVVLPFSMGSLDKVKSSDAKLERWASVYEGPYTISDKIDGASLLYDNRATHEIKLYTRGKENVGRDVSHLIGALKLPKGKGIAVRGELVMSDKLFDKHHSDEYENARNLVSSILTKKSTDLSLLKNCKFIAHELIYPSMSPSKGLARLKALGFETVWNKTVPNVTNAALVKILEARKGRADYSMDGLVVAQDQKNNRPTTGNPAYAVAFKVLDEDAIAEAKVIGIEWNVSKHGLIKPVLLIEPTRLSGVTVRRVTAHNAKTVRKFKLGKGAVIRCTRSGDVIPLLLSVVKPCKTWDEPNFEYEWDANETDIVATTKHDVQKIKAITSFFTTLGVDFLGEGVVTQLFDAGFTSVKKILRAKPADFLQVEGFQTKKAQKLYDAIVAKTRNVELVKLLDATGVFGRGFGERRIRPILDVYPDLVALSKLPESQVQANIERIKGYSEITAKQFATNLKRAITRLEKLGITYEIKEKAKPLGNKLSRKSFLFTGFRSKEAEEHIISQGGTLASGVTKELTALVIKDVASSSSKAVKARSLNVPLLTLDQFKSKYWR
jgi:DNA ligase (NAD+)